MVTEAGAGHVPRRVGAVHACLLAMHHGELRRARAHAAAVARKQIAVAALLTLAARRALNGGDWDGHVMLGLQVRGRAPSGRLAADGRKSGADGVGGDEASRAWLELEPTFALPGGGVGQAVPILLCMRS